MAYGAWDFILIITCYTVRALIKKIRESVISKNKKLKEGRTIPPPPLFNKENV